MGPNFFIVGAPRCGTTAMSTYLADHDQICFSKPKEPHFFCTDMPAMRYIEDHEAYLACFDHCSGISFQAVGEGSVWYLYSPAAISNILHRYPQAKFIAMVRNPLEMVPSFHQKAIESLDEDEEKFDQAWQLNGMRRQGHNLPTRCRDRRLLDYAWVGKMGVQLQRLFQQVDASQRMVVVYDDLARDPISTYKDVLAFLQVEYDGRTDFPKVNANRRVRSQAFLSFAKSPPASLVKLGAFGRKITGRDRLGVLPKLRRSLTIETRRPSLSESLRASMLEEFSADIDLLGRLLHRDLSHWKR